MTKEFEEGIHAREIGLHLINNPYFMTFDKRYRDWTNGWKLENWRILKMGKINVKEQENAKREEINRQIQADRNIRSDAESSGG